MDLSGLRLAPGDLRHERPHVHLLPLVLGGQSYTVTPEVIEGLYAADFDHLQRLYERLNTAGEFVGSVACPDCNRDFEVDLAEIQDGSPGK